MDFDKAFDKVELGSLKIEKEKAQDTIERFYTYLKEDGNQMFRGRKRNRLF